MSRIVLWYLHIIDGMNPTSIFLMSLTSQTLFLVLNALSARRGAEPLTCIKYCFIHIITTLFELP